ncbi:MAG TPA: PAS domain S-box protein, partial [Candidatus Aminicenantes bacterium]|nr:PAS domain S-box protein [Candidatus Aminicenantes bacterium]
GGKAWPLTGGEEAATRPLPRIFRADNQTPFPHEELPLSRAVRRGETSLNVEMVIRRPDGEARWIIVSAVPVRNPQGQIVAGISVFHDVTTQKRSEFSLRSSEEQYRIVFESTSTPLMIMRADTVIVMCNPAFERLTGYSREETEGRLSWTHFVVPAEVERLKAFHVQRRIDPASVPSGYEFQMVDRKGNIKDIATSIAMLPDHTHSLASLYDITTRKQSERALAESENLYRAIFDNTGTASIIIEGDATIALANPEWLRLSGFGKEETEGKQHWTQFVVPEDLERMMGYHRARRESPEKAPRKYEFRFVRRNGEIRDILNSVTVIPGTKRSLASLIDITELKHAEAALRHTQKLESLGLLAGGIAHDFNNILTAAIGHLNLAQLSIPDSAPAGHNLKMLEQALLKATNLTRQMLAYSGKGKFMVRVLNLNLFIQEMLPLLQVGISKKALVRFEPSLAPARIEADTAQLQQVVMNLVTNAADAIGEREGTITLKTTIEELGETAIHQAPQQQDLLPGRYVVLEVSDTGCG